MQLLYECVLCVVVIVNLILINVIVMNKRGAYMYFVHCFVFQ